MPLTIRASSLPDAQDCMRRMVSNQYQELLTDAGYIIPEGKSTVASSLVGTGTHSAGEYMLTEKINTGKLSTVDQAIEAGIEKYESEFDKYERVDFGKSVYNYEAGIKQIQRYTKIYHRDVAPLMKFPEGAKPEEHLELFIKKPYKHYNISGHIDVFTGKSICDTKTGKNIKSWHTQNGAYGLLMGEDNFEKLYINFLPRVPLDKNYPGTKTVEYEKKFAIIEAFGVIETIINCLNRFKEKGDADIIPANPNSYLCTKKYCKCFGTSFCCYKS